MNEKRIVGSGRTVGGKIQEAAGQVTCDAKTRVEGELNEASRAQDLNGTKDAAADTVGALEEGAETIECATLLRPGLTPPQQSLSASAG